jgi:hypothetical protein
MPKNGIPANFKLMPSAQLKAAVEGIPDLLSAQHYKAEALYRQHNACPNGCGPTMEKSFGGTAFAFSDDEWQIPRCIMKCHICGCSRNPFDGMIVELGDPNKAVVGNIPIIGAG